MSSNLLTAFPGTDLERYLKEVARHPLLDVDAERDLAERWRDRRTTTPRASWSAAISAWWSRSPAASGATACRSTT